MRASLRRIYVPLGTVTLVAVASGCARELETEEPIETSAATLARFEPNADDPCLSVVPFPTDLTKDPETGRLNIPICRTDDASAITLKRGLRTRDGFALATDIYAPMSADIDPATLPGNVLFINTATGAPVPFTPGWDPAQRNITIEPDAPLDPATRYLAAITSGVTDVDGNPVISNQVFTLLKSEEPLVDELGFSRFTAVPNENAFALEPVRQAFVPVLDALAAAGVPRENVAVAWFFTTQSTTGPLESATDYAWATVEHENSVPAASHPLLALAGIPLDNLCDVHTGRFAPTGDITPADVIGLPTAAALSFQPVDYLLITPQGSTGDCSQPWNGQQVAVFVHGLGRCKNDAVALANSLAAAGFATLSLDGPRAGARTVTTAGDQDLDGCPDQPSTPELILLPGESQPNPFALADNLQLWAFEVAHAVDVAFTDPLALVGTSDTTQAALVGVVGHSWGGVAASLAGVITPNLGALATTVTPGNLGQAFGPLIGAEALAALTGAGIDPDSDLGQSILNSEVKAAVDAFTWVLEPSDPVQAARAWPSALPVLTQVSDGGTAAQVPLHDTQSQLALATAADQPLAEVLFGLTCTEDGASALICDSSDGIVAAPLQPCVSNPGNENFPLALARTVDMQTQLVSFLASSGACRGALTGTGCDPLPTAGGTEPQCPTTP